MFPQLAGQAVGAINRLENAGDLVLKIVNEAKDSIPRMTFLISKLESFLACDYPPYLDSVIPKRTVDYITESHDTSSYLRTLIMN